MLTLYRGMKASADGHPECGDTGRSLGVRVPEDIAPDSDGRVHPKAGGMSCAPDDPMLLRPHRRPRALYGTGPDAVFAIPVGDLGAALAARRDSPTHALVEPTTTTELATFVSTLHASRPRCTRIA